MTKHNLHPNIDALIGEIRKILHEYPEGLSEYELINRLGDSNTGNTAQSGSALFRDSLQLFQVHFLVFHALYRIRQDLWNDGLGMLEINPVKISISEFVDHAPGNLAQPDPLSEYYGDLDNLENITVDEIDQMLGKFWSGFVTVSDKQAALEILELSEPLEPQAIKAQYRRLVMLHHPDRGGSHEKIQQINQAMNVLSRYLAH